MQVEVVRKGGKENRKGMRKKIFFLCILKVKGEIKGKERKWKEIMVKFNEFKNLL